VGDVGLVLDFIVAVVMRWKGGVMSESEREMVGVEALRAMRMVARGWVSLGVGGL
jgi:hypothetical protein